MSEIKKRHIKILFMGTDVPNISSNEENIDVAFRAWDSFDSKYHYNNQLTPEIFSIEVDGEIFTMDQIRNRR